MSTGYAHLVTSLENRYDYHSARVVASDALLSAGLAEADSYKPAELQKIVDVLGEGARHMDGVWLALGLCPAGSAMPEAPAAVVADDAGADGEASAEASEKKAPAKKAPAKKAAPKKTATKK